MASETMAAARQTRWAVVPDNAKDSVRNPAESGRRSVKLLLGQSKKEKSKKKRTDSPKRRQRKLLESLPRKSVWRKRERPKKSAKQRRRKRKKNVKLVLPQREPS